MSQNNDLISRSALLKKIGTNRYYSIDPCNQRGKIFRMVELAPTVDAEVVRHGCWIPQDNTRTKFMCSDCKSRNHDGSGKYCSLCGCKMDGEQNDVQRV